MEAIHPLLQVLNPQQRAAVTTEFPTVLVLAGPGSGKTRVLTHRIAWMLAEMGVPAWQVLAVTFTNKAAREMRHRVARMLDGYAAREVTLGTFHATCARILRREAEAAGLSPDYVIFDSDDQLALMKRVVRELGLDEKRYRPRALLNAVSAAKNELIPPSTYPVRTYRDEIVVRAYRRYQEALRGSNGLDFDDLLMETARLLQEEPEIRAKYQRRYHYILVDEFQDTNMAQYVILRLLAQEHRHLYVVADEDQSIYSWRGADYRNIRRLRRDFPDLREFLLEENYRSTSVILEGAQAVIARNPDRTPKRLFTRRKGGEPITLHEAYDEREEAEYVARQIERLRRRGYAPADIAVMYRTNAQSRALEEAMVAHHIPYRLIGAVRFYARREIKDVLAYLRLVQNSDDDVSLMRVINTPPRGIGTRTLAKVTTRAGAMGVSRYRAILALLEEGKLGRRTHNALLAFTSMVEAWRQERDRLSVAGLIDRILADVAYERYLRDGTRGGDARWENVLALRGVAEEAADASLRDFLADVALVADVDELEEGVEAVTLLTLHSAKGLEFPVVFITGLEDGLLPHSRSMDSPQEIAEERRLLYVGMTRAKDLLYLTYAFRRSWYNQGGPATPSRFLADLPDAVLASRRRATTDSPRRQAPQGWVRHRAAPPAPQYRIGQRVRHTYYGEGIVTGSEVYGRNEMVTVVFEDGVGVKRLLVGVAPMEPLPER